MSYEDTSYGPSFPPSDEQLVGADGFQSWAAGIACAENILTQQPVCCPSGEYLSPEFHMCEVPCIPSRHHLCPL